ncbi:MAG: helix-turn-helix transcriptional regulator [Myxococcales bacterium]|nr:helix-turn-helix transcriptional regulator [Myxococcales bacterium]
MTPGAHDRLSAALLALHQRARTAAVASFQAEALAVVDELIGFDSALWGCGRLGAGGPIPHSVHLDRQPPEMMASYEEIKAHDPSVRASATHLGRTSNVAIDHLGEGVHPGAVAHARRYGMRHTLATLLADPDLRLFSAVSLYRADPARPFSEADRQLAQAVVPHLEETWTWCRLRAVDDGGSARHARMLCDPCGVIHAASAGLASELRREWPAWRGPDVPAPIVPILATPGARFVGAAVVVTGGAVGALRLLTVRGITALDRLTAREAEVARRFGQGASHVAIATALGIAPATVRNHVQAIYRKLGVGDKAALANALRDDASA